MTVLDMAGWALTAAPYVPAAMVLGALIGAVYAAHLTTGTWRKRRAERAEARRNQHPLVRRYHDGPDALQELALLDHHLDQYAASIQPLYPTGEQQQ
jgi:hypothetical protein